MQFSTALKQQLMGKFTDTGITMEAEDINSALTQAWALFSSNQKSGPPATQNLPVILWLAVDILQPIAAKLFGTDGTTNGV